MKRFYDLSSFGLPLTALNTSNNRFLLRARCVDTLIFLPSLCKLLTDCTKSAVLHHKTRIRDPRIKMWHTSRPFHPLSNLSV